jgi:MFS family permease
MSRVRATDRTGAGLGREFNLLWTGQSVSFIGDRITLLVVPAVVVLLLGGSAFDVGVISTAQYLAIPVLSLVAGALADRWDLRRMMIGCDLIRFAAIAIIPVAYWLGFLQLSLLFVCVVVVSVATVFFQVGYMPAMAATVRRSELVRANSRMEASRTVSELGGPAAAGGLYQLLGVGALVVDALTYLTSAVAIRAMRPFGERSGAGQRVLARSMDGMRWNWTDPVLRKSTAGTLLSNIGGPIFVTQMPVLAYQGLGLSAGTFGIVMSIAAGGAVLGAVTATRVSRQIGSGSMLGLSMVAHSLSGLGIIAAPRYPAVAVLALTLSSYGFFAAWYDINSASIRQARVPIRDQTVVHGAYRTITWGVIPVSAFVGGWVVSGLARQMPILDAAKYTMLVATVIGVSAIIPLARLQRLLDTEPAVTPAGGSATADDSRTS